MNTEWERQINACLHRMEEAENSFDPEESDEELLPLSLRAEDPPDALPPAARVRFIVEEQDD